LIPFPPLAWGKGPFSGATHGHLCPFPPLAWGKGSGDGGQPNARCGCSTSALLRTNLPAGFRPRRGVLFLVAVNVLLTAAVFDKVMVAMFADQSQYDKVEATMTTVFGLLAVFILVFINGFFVSAEFALVGSRRTRITQLARAGHAGARAADYAIGHLDSYIAATQLGITLASLGLGWIGEPAVAHVLEPLLDSVMPSGLAHALGPGVSVAIGFSLVTMLHIVLGELTPKAIALQRPEGTALIVSPPTTWFLKLFHPAIELLNAVGNAVVRLLGFEPTHGHDRVHSIEELLMLVHSSQEAGLLPPSEERLVRRVFDFGDIHINEVMQPRTEVEAIAVDTPLSELLEKVSSGHYSRYPVYKDTIDQVVGILHTRDLLTQIISHPDLLADGATFDLSSLLRAPLFFPEMAPVDRVLEQMQRAKTHATIVVDEFGGMAGFATMEDILEELVGEVQDEFDAEGLPISADAKGIVVDGLVSLDDVIDRFGDPGGEPGSATIGGYVAERLDRIPTVGDKITFGDYDLYVEEMDEMRVARVRFVTRVRNGTELSHP
jgi:putative hemolysin